METPTSSVRSQRTPATGYPAEESGYLEHKGAQLYYVLHAPAQPRRGQALLAGPFASERNTTYIPWVRWARFLAREGYETMRFDYRGVGESTGVFETMTLAGWYEDLKVSAAWLTARSASPLVLHGLELGGLLAAKAVAEGIGQALLLWSPPTSARDLLLSRLRQKIFIEYANKSGARRMSRDDYIKELETGKCIEVEGFHWSPGLWKESGAFPPISENVDKAGTGCGPMRRPTRLTNLDSSKEPLVQGRRKLLNPNLEGLFRDELEWVNRTLG